MLWFKKILTGSQITNLDQSNERESEFPRKKPSLNTKAVIYEDEANEIANLTLQYPNIETGGSLFGYWTNSNAPVVTYVSGPGIGSRHNHSSFYQDERFLFNLGTTLFDKHGLQHIGEWHSHHRLGLNEPSRGDLDTIFNGMQRHNLSRFLLVITTINNSNDPLIYQNYYLFTIDNSGPKPARIHLLPGSSPFRDLSYRNQEEPRKNHEKGKWIPGPHTPNPDLHQNVNQVFPNAWFTKSESRKLLISIVNQFAEVGIKCDVKVFKQDQEKVELNLGEDSLIIDSKYPNSPPRWKDDNRALYDWTPDSHIVKLYSREKQLNK